MDESSKARGLSRRTFITGMSMGALGLAGMGLAGCAGEPNPNKQQADPSDSAEPSNSTGSPESLNADVCVIGAGPAGLTAAINAAEAGAQVLVIDQLEDIGVCGHSITAVGTPWQDEAGITMTPEDLVDFWATYDDPHLDRDLMLFVARESAATIAWLDEHGPTFVGVTVPPTNPFQEPMCTFVTTGGRDGKASYLNPLKATADALGIEFKFATTASGLVQDESGAVVGVTATGSDGHEVRIDARSTIIASGGFGSNTDLVRLYAPRTPNVGPVTGIANGFAVTVAPAIGAELVMPGGTQALFSNPGKVGPDHAGQGLFVDGDGRRFINENLYTFDRSAIAFKQGISRYYALYDEPTTSTLYGMPKDGFAAGVESGAVVTADTVEELAGKLGINAAALAATVEAYNGYCETGIDEEFGKPAARTGRVTDPDKANEYDPDVIEREFKLLNPLATPPFYAVSMVADSTYLTGTQGGLKINADAEVFSTNGTPLPGLFAAGEAANGQVFGYAYPQSGASLCLCFTLGRFAGASAAAYAVSTR